MAKTFALKPKDANNYSLLGEHFLSAGNGPML